MNKMMLKKQYMMYSPKKGRLPSDYQEVEYIESTGTQYIDSGIFVSDLSNIINMKYRFVPTNSLTTSESLYLGTYGTYPNYFMQLTTRSNISSIYFYCGNPEQGGEASFTRNNWQNYEQYLEVNINGKSGNVSLNGTQKTFSYAKPTINGSLYIGALNNNGSASINSKTRIYEFSFKDDGTLIRDYIPCYRKSDNEIGMYDIVNNQFYTNSGSGTFLMGRPLVNDTISGYQQVDYIESTGTQYIDTSVLQTNSIGTFVDIQFTNNQIETFAPFLETYDGTNNPSYLSIKKATTWGLLSATTYGYYGEFIPYETTSSFARHTYEYSNGNWLLDNVLVGSSKSIIYNTNLSLYLFSMHRTSGTMTFSIAKLYYCKLYDNNVLVRNLIPMRRLSDNELGLYDLVNGVFYTNQGSGNFIAGEVLKA